MGMTKVNLDEMLSRSADRWSPKSVGRLNDYELKVVKVQGEFVWHQHDETDEVFLVLDGKLTIDTPDGAIVLGPRETVMIPRASSTGRGRSERPRSF
jgi:mannose-6-phosphate isomerase-like protein (cupin superfamily)